MSEARHENELRMHVDTYVQDRILRAITNEKGGDFSELGDRITHLNQYFDLSESFHQPKGEGYKLVQHCLQKYLDFKFIRENNTFRFHEKLFDQRVEILQDSEEYNYQYFLSDHGMNGKDDVTRADIYYLLHEADQEGLATRRCIHYVNSNRLHLTAVLVQMIERIVTNLEENPLKKYQEYGKVLRAAYMTPAYADLDVFGLFDILGYSKKKYYRIRNAAISLISETLFGVLAGEHGFADLYIYNNEIHVSDKD